MFDPSAREKCLTESDVPVPHEGSHIDGFIRGEAGDLAAGENIPGNTGVASIIAYCKPACAALTRIVHYYPLHIFMVSFKPSFDR
jgi:hypothetical protein